MKYLISFLEGFITFISPCMLPMIPIYLSYVTGGDEAKRSPLLNSVGFVLGFTGIFVALGAFAGTLGAFVFNNSRLFEIVGGSIFIIFGLNYMNVIHIKFLHNVLRVNTKKTGSGFVSSILFGVVFSIGWSPCVGTFLSGALLLAANEATVLNGVLLLLAFSMGLGIPFIVTALLIDKLKGTFDFLKRNMKTINIVSGVFLIAIGAAMLFGIFDNFLHLFS